MRERSYIPALGFDWLTRFYDPLLALSLREKTLKGRLIDQAAIAPGHDVLDVGCGTGTLAILAKNRQPEARVVGLDIAGAGVYTCLTIGAQLLVHLNTTTPRKMGYFFQRPEMHRVHHQPFCRRRSR